MDEKDMSTAKWTTLSYFFIYKGFFYKTKMIQQHWLIIFLFLFIDNTFIK